MFNEWKNYLNDRLIKHDDDVCIIIPKDNCERLPISCNICESLYRSHEDEESHHKFGCCYSCASTWAYQNQEKWKSGWRPTQEQINESMYNRILLLLEQ